MNDENKLINKRPKILEMEDKFLEIVNLLIKEKIITKSEFYKLIKKDMILNKNSY